MPTAASNKERPAKTPIRVKLNLRCANDSPSTCSIANLRKGVHAGPVRRQEVELREMRKGQGMIEGGRVADIGFPWV